MITNNKYEVDIENIEKESQPVLQENNNIDY